MRRLPVYLVLDVSGSMSGEPIESVKNAVDGLVSTLRQDPQSLETVYLSVITFSDDASQLVPLTELPSFQTPALSPSGQTSFGRALKLLSQRIRAEVTKSTFEQKGDWKPMVVLMTDGQPTDNLSDIEEGLREFQSVKTGIVIACGAGSSADTTFLKKISETVVTLATTDSRSITAFFKWVSDSIAIGSQRIEQGQGDPSQSTLPPPPPQVSIVV